jgi:hypothetical protein
MEDSFSERAAVRTTGRLEPTVRSVPAGGEVSRRALPPSSASLVQRGMSLEPDATFH